MNTKRSFIGASVILVTLLIFSASLALAAKGGGKGGGGGSSGGGGSGGGGGGLTIGTPGATVPEKYYFPAGVSVSGTLNIVGPVIIVSDGDFAIGNNTVAIAQGGKLELYVKGNVTINGNGSFNNNNDPEHLMIFGTNPTSQSITLSGNAIFSGAIYAPNAAITKNGGGAVGAFFGAAVAKSVTFNGSPGPFHYDESLGRLGYGGSSGFELKDYQIAEGPSSTVAADYLPDGFDSGTTVRSLFSHYFEDEVGDY